MRLRPLLVLLLISFVLAIPAKAAGPPLQMRMVGIEVAPPAYIKAGSTYTMTVRFAGLALGDRPGVWQTSLLVSGSLDQNNKPVHCGPESALAIVGGDWQMLTWSGAIHGKVSSGQLAFRPDQPIIGECMGPVPADLRLTVGDASGPYAAIAHATISHGIIDHRVVPPTIGASVLLK